VIAFTAHYYGISPLEVESWRTKEITEWYNEAALLEKEKWKSFNKGSE
jgi:hypothetical protein